MFKYLWIAMQIASAIEALKDNASVPIEIRGIKIGDKKARLVGVIHPE